MVSYEVFLPDLRLKAYGVSDPVALHVIRNTIIDICEKTRIWNRLSSEFVFKGDSRVGMSDIDETQEELEAVLNAWLDHVPLKILNHSAANVSRFADMTFEGESVGAPTHYFQIPGECDIGLWPNPDQNYAGRLQVKIALKPTPDSTQFEDMFWRDWRKAVLAGALAELHDMEGHSFSNPGKASAKGVQYAQEVLKIRIAAQRGRLVSGDAQVQMRAFGPVTRWGR